MPAPALHSVDTVDTVLILCRYSVDIYTPGHCSQAGHTNKSSHLTTADTHGTWLQTLQIQTRVCVILSDSFLSELLLCFIRALKDNEGEKTCQL